MITGGGRGESKKSLKNDYIICEWSLTSKKKKIYFLFADIAQIGGWEVNLISKKQFLTKREEGGEKMYFLIDYLSKLVSKSVEIFHTFLNPQLPPPFLKMEWA